MRTIRGVDVAALGDQFDRMVPNRVLLLDGDGAAYRSSATVKKLALAHVEDLEAKIAEMQSMVQTLKHLAHHCHGDDRPDCPILEDLAS